MSTLGGNEALCQAEKAGVNKKGRESKDRKKHLSVVVCDLNIRRWAGGRDSRLLSFNSLYNMVHMGQFSKREPIWCEP